MIMKHMASALLVALVLVGVAVPASAECVPEGWTEGPNPKVIWRCPERDE
jgi:hypothetical protein